MARIACLVQLDEEFLGVAVETTLAHLVGGDFGEGVVATFLSHVQLELAQVTREHPRARGVTSPLHSDLGKEFVRDSQHVHRRKLCSEEMPHIRAKYLVPKLSAPFESNPRARAASAGLCLA